MRRKVLYAIYTDGEAYFHWMLECGHKVKRGWHHHSANPRRVRCRQCEARRNFD